MEIILNLSANVQGKLVMYIHYAQSRDEINNELTFLTPCDHSWVENWVDNYFFTKGRNT